MPERLIEIRGLNKEYLQGSTVVRALRDVDLDVCRGEYVSVVGPSGSGKTTLFNMIGALDVPTSGSIRIDGTDLAELGGRQQAAFRGQRIGFVFQKYNLLPTCTALENVATPLVFGGLSYSEAVARGREMLERVGLGDRLTHRPDALSGGQQQRVAIARALAHDPAIVLADEPTGNLDAQTGAEIIALFGRLTEELGVTLLAATHDESVLAASGRIVRLRAGRVEGIEERAGGGRVGGYPAEAPAVEAT